MRYIRMYKGSEDGAPGVTLYEVDASGWVHRQLQVHADGVRFSPEDILLRRPVSISYMCKHPDAEEISVEEFELHWAEFDHRRRFREQLPNPWRAWQGRMPGDASRPGAAEERSLRWEPSGAHPGDGWIRVPGFVRLYVYGSSEEAWATQRELFLERNIEWSALTSDLSVHGVHDVPVTARQIIDGPGLAGALWNESRTQHGSMMMS
jgi:hypothetical protein